MAVLKLGRSFLMFFFQALHQINKSVFYYAQKLPQRQSQVDVEPVAVLKKRDTICLLVINIMFKGKEV